MLVLSRKSDTSLQILSGEHQIEVTILQVKGATVRVGVSAPREVVVLRSELCDDEREAA